MPGTKTRRTDDHIGGNDAVTAGGEGRPLRLTPTALNRVVAFFRILLEWDEAQHTMDGLKGIKGADGDGSNGNNQPGRAVRPRFVQGPGA